MMTSQSRIASPRVNHINAVFEGGANDIVLGKVCRDWGHANTDAISFIGLVDVLVDFSCSYMPAMPRTF